MRLTRKRKIWDNANMDDNGYLTAVAIGHAAHETLQTETYVNICGNTSKGFFAVTDNKKILFISHQRFKGPLTINTIKKLPARQRLSHDTHLLLSPDRIRFIKSGLEIRINPQTLVWTPMILNKLDFNLEAFITRSNLIEREMIAQLSNQDQSQENMTGIENILRFALSSRNKLAVYKSLSNLLG